MSFTEDQYCSVCHRQADPLFSNRPLHKGRRQTLLICAGCLAAAAPAGQGACSWCGGEDFATAPVGRFSICASCIDLCRDMLSQ